MVVTSGVSTIRLNGSSTNMTIRQSGVSRLDASSWKAKNVDVSVSGTGDVSVRADTSINIHVSGMSTVTVYGNPPIRNIEQDNPFQQNVVFV